MPPGEPRQHHYAPEAYLAGFTSDGRRETRLCVTDLVRKRQFETLPAKTGKERDFYTVERDDDGDVHEVEHWFAKHVDHHGARVLQDLDRTTEMPTGADRAWLMYFIAGMVLRGPFFRQRLDSFTDDLTKRLMSDVADDDAAFKEFTALIPEGVREQGDEDNSSLRNFMRSKKYSVTIEPTYYIGLMLKLLVPLSQSLCSRRWQVICARDTEHQFVCSDHPVSLLFKLPYGLPMGPGYAMKQTLAFFPVNRQVALVGSFELEPPLLPGALNRVVAWINGQTARHAVRFVYSPSREISWMRDDETVQGTAALMRLNRMPLTEPAAYR